MLILHKCSGPRSVSEQCKMLLGRIKYWSNYFPFSGILLSFAENSGRLTPLRHTSLAARTALPTKVRADVDACQCTRGLYGHRERVCVENDL